MANDFFYFAVHTLDIALDKAGVWRSDVSGLH